MARIENITGQPTTPGQRAAELLREARGKFGPGIGEAMVHYLHGFPQSEVEREQLRRIFAEAVATGLEGSHEEKVNAVRALLTVVDEKLAPVAAQASRADSYNRIYGGHH